MADSLTGRGFCLREARRYREAAEAFALASSLMPYPRMLDSSVGETMSRWWKEIRPRIPPITPELEIHYPPRRFSGIPEAVEQKIVSMGVLQDLLDDPVMDQRWWEPLRRHPGRLPFDLPRQIVVDFREQK